ncbi:hypothetical protein BDFB_014973, partial [Asbolus verrucosus]
KTDWKKFTTHLAENYGNIAIIDSKQDLEEAVQKFEEKTREAIGASTRVFTEPRTRNTIPQWIVELIKAKNRARRRAHRTGDPADRREANRLTNEVRYFLSDFRNQQWENKL